MFLQSAPIDVDHLNARDWWRNVDRDGDGCWLWQQSCGSHGYGQTWDNVTVRLAHRVAWTLTYGPIPADMTVDHICRNRRCCNPNHLRLLSNVDNARDNGFATRTHCPAGHPYTEDNIYRQPSKPLARRCVTCQTISNRKRRYRNQRPVA